MTKRPQEIGTTPPPPPRHREVTRGGWGQWDVTPREGCGALGVPREGAGGGMRTSTGLGGGTAGEVGVTESIFWV